MMQCQTWLVFFQMALVPFGAKYNRNSIFIGHQLV